MKWREDVRQTDLGENESLKKKEQEEGHKRERGLFTVLNE